MPRALVCSDRRRGQGEGTFSCTPRRSPCCCRWWMASVTPPAPWRVLQSPAITTTSRTHRGRHGAAARWRSVALPHGYPGHREI